MDLQESADILWQATGEAVATDEIRDAIGELVNRVAGNVKTALSATHSLAIALPTVVMTPKPDMRVKGATSTVVTFLDPTGEFDVELVVSDSENAASGSSPG